MRLLSRLSGNAWSRAPVVITHVQVTYVGSFTVHAAEVPGHVVVELAWSSKTETVLTADGAVWDRRVVAGPDIDRLLVEDADALPATTVGDIVVTYPVVLGAQRGTVRATAPGVVRVPLPV